MRPCDEYDHPEQPNSQLRTDQVSENGLFWKQNQHRAHLDEILQQAVIHTSLLASRVNYNLPYFPRRQQISMPAEQVHNIVQYAVQFPNVALNKESKLWGQAH